MTQTLAVVLATKNGARFIEEQLESIAAQTRPPDALVISDDGSSDETLTLCSRFSTAASFPVTVLAAGYPGGRAGAVDRVSSAFARGIEAVGDATLVAFCDQDDVWFSDKLERSVGALGERPDATFVCGDAELMDEAGDPLPGRLSDRWPVPPEWSAWSRAEQLRFALRNPFATGATMVVRSSLLDAAMPVPQGWLHDRWLSVVGCALGGAVTLRSPVMRYRVHGGQAWGLDRGGGDTRALAVLRRAETLGRKALQVRSRMAAVALPPDVRDELRWRSLMFARPFSGRGSRAAI
jgi:glycosyltransferase involved in cell wall biosynthesis